MNTLSSIRLIHILFPFTSRFRLWVVVAAGADSILCCSFFVDDA